VSARRHRPAKIGVQTSRDTALIRAHPGTPEQANIFGYFDDIDTGALAALVQDRAGSARRA